MSKNQLIELFERYNEYKKTVEEISKNDDNECLVKSNLILFNMDDISEECSPKGNTHKSVDGMEYFVENNIFKLFLIEFKGGIEFNEEYKLNLRLKPLETIICLIPRMYDSNEILSYLLSKECEISYYVVCDDTNIKFNKYSDNTTFRNRQIYKTESEDILFGLKRFKQFPFKSIHTLMSQDFNIIENELKNKI
ncbi:MAG: hypothetical protein ACRCVG_06425 [Methanobacteriaceae archaeon]